MASSSTLSLIFKMDFEAAMTLKYRGVLGYLPLLPCCTLPFEDQGIFAIYDTRVIYCVSDRHGWIVAFIITKLGSRGTKNHLVLPNFSSRLQDRSSHLNAFDIISLVRTR